MLYDDIHRDYTDKIHTSHDQSRPHPRSHFHSRPHPPSHFHSYTLPIFSACLQPQVIPKSKILTFRVPNMVNPHHSNGLPHPPIKVVGLRIGEAITEETLLPPVTITAVLYEHMVSCEHFKCGGPVGPLIVRFRCTATLTVSVLLVQIFFCG